MGIPNDVVATAVDSKNKMQTVKFPFNMFNHDENEWQAQAFINIPESAYENDKESFLQMEAWFKLAVDAKAITVDAAKLEELGIPAIQFSAAPMFQAKKRSASSFVKPEA